MPNPPPPFGHPWYADVSRNPNINRDPPPPPFDALPNAVHPGHILVNRPGPAAATTAQHVVVEAAPGAGSVIVEGGIPAVGVGMPGMGISLDPFSAGYGMGMYNTDGLAPPQLGAYMKYPHLAGYGRLGFGGFGYGVGLGYPPPPIGMGGFAPPPFAPGNPLWAAGGIGMYGGMGLFGDRPAPGVHSNGNNNGSVPPAQPDITVVSGGVPPGVTEVAAEEYTIVIRIKSVVEPWLQPVQPMVCESLNIDSSTSLNRLIQVCRENQDCDGYALFMIRHRPLRGH